MRILLIEDDQNKLKQLEHFILRQAPTAHISVRRSYQSGLEAVMASSFDLVLLDMSLPTYDQSPNEAGGRKRPFAGKEILRQMNRKHILSSVVVITQFTRFGEESETISLSQLRSDLGSAGYEIYRGTIYYSAEAANWESELREVLEKVSALE